MSYQFQFYSFRLTLKSPIKSRDGKKKEIVKEVRLPPAVRGGAGHPPTRPKPTMIIASNAEAM